MTYEYMNDEVENKKLLDNIKSKLNASSSNFLDIQLINEITNDLWNKTNKNEDRCISIINKLSSKIKKTEDFKSKSIEYITRLSSNKKINKNYIISNQLNFQILEKIPKNYFIAIIVFIILTSLGLLYFKQNNTILNCYLPSNKITFSFKEDNNLFSTNEIFIKKGTDWKVFCPCEKRKNKNLSCELTYHQKIENCGKTNLEYTGKIGISFETLILEIGNKSYRRDYQCSKVRQ